MRCLEVLLFCLLCCLSLAKGYENGSEDAFWKLWIQNYTKEPFTLGSRIGGDNEDTLFEKIIDITKQKLSQPLNSEETRISDREMSDFLQNTVKDIEPPVEVEDAKALKAAKAAKASKAAKAVKASKAAKAAKAFQAQESDRDMSEFLQNMAKTLKVRFETPVEVEEATGSSQEPQNDDEATRLLVMSLLHKKETLLKEEPDLINIPID